MPSPTTFSPALSAPFRFRDHLSSLRAPKTTVLYVSDLQAAIREAKPGSVGRLSQLRRQSLESSALLVSDPAQDHVEARELCELIEGKTQLFRNALEKINLPREAVDLFVSFVDFRLDTQAALYDLELERILLSLKGRDTSDMGTAEDLAAALNVSAETVRRRTVDRTLIAVLAPGRKRGREYPMFQAWPGVAGKPLEAVLDALGRPEGPEAYQFMTTPSDFLGGLSPIEVLVGDAPQGAELAPGAREFLQQSDELRLRAAVDAAAQRVSAREAA